MAAWNKTVQISIATVKISIATVQTSIATVKISIATVQISIAAVSILPNLPQEHFKYSEVKPGDKEWTERSLVPVISFGLNKRA